MSNLFILCERHDTGALTEELKCKFDVFRSIKIKNNTRQFRLWKRGSGSEIEIKYKQLPDYCDILLVHRSEKHKIEGLKINFGRKFIFSTVGLRREDIKTYNKISLSFILIPREFGPGTKFLSADEVDQIYKCNNFIGDTEIPAFCRFPKLLPSRNLLCLLLSLHLFLALWKSNNSKYSSLSITSTSIENAIDLMGLNFDIPPVSNEIYKWAQNKMFVELLCSDDGGTDLKHRWLLFEDAVNRELDKIVQQGKGHTISLGFANTRELWSLLRSDTKIASSHADLVSASIVEITKLLSNPVLSEQSLMMEKRRRDINHYFIKTKLIISVDGLVADIKNGHRLIPFKDEIEEVCKKLKKMSQELNSFLSDYKLTMSPSTLIEELFTRITQNYKPVFEQILHNSWLCRCSIDKKLNNLKQFVQNMDYKSRLLDKIIVDYEEGSKAHFKELVETLIYISDKLHNLSEQLSCLNADGYLYHATE